MEKSQKKGQKTRKTPF